MEKIFVTKGVYYVLIPEADLRILCGCPPDVTKHLMKRGIIAQKAWDKGLYETGPNAILLSDLPIQGGKLSNLAEFPILQMFYNQGMLIPGHPGNTGKKPILLGTQEQLDAVGEYLFRGTYGLANQQEVEATGVDPEMAKEIIRIKLSFAFGKIRKSEELITMIPLEEEPAEIVPGVWIKRSETNRFTIHQSSISTDTGLSQKAKQKLAPNELSINLNLKSGETYEAPVSLDFHVTKREYFSVIHIGEGNGWDTERPCMASIVSFQGKLYLIDTGPNVIDSLTALGISVNEIEGIIHTHAHDDHFAGLTSMIRTDHRVKYYAAPFVRSGVMKKMAAITGIPEEQFLKTFEIHDLKVGEWNNLEGLEVKPVFSLHPVETTVFFFRTLWAGGYKTYGHLADIASDQVMRQILIEAPDANEYSKTLYRTMWESLFVPADIKKIDIGGGMIHGTAKDFIKDTSPKIVLAHLNRPLNTEEKEIGSNSSFGQEDILVPAQQDYVRKAAALYIYKYFPNSKPAEVQMLLNCRSKLLNPGIIIQKKGSKPKYVYLTITGVSELIEADSDLEFMLSAGTIIGELDALGGDSTRFTYRARSYVNVLEIPSELYLPFIERNANLVKVKQTAEDMLLLQSTRLFGEMVSSPVLHKIASTVKYSKVAKGSKITDFNGQRLWMITKGSAELRAADTLIEKLGLGEFFGEHGSKPWLTSKQISVVCTSDCQLMSVSLPVLQEVPILEWKLLELCERRLGICKSRVGWDPCPKE